MAARAFVFEAPVTKELKEQIMTQSRQQLATMLGMEVDDVMAGYVATMVANKKSMAQIAQALVDFIGEEHADAFVQWLGGTLLPSLAAAAAGPQDDAAMPAAQDEPDATAPTAAAPAKRVISLKGISSTSTASSPAASSSDSKRVASLNATGSTSSGSVRSLQGPKSDDMRDVLARRSQRFGMPEKESAPEKDKRKELKRRADRDAEETTTNSRRPTSAGGRLAQRLGPPVVRAETTASDARDANKRRRTSRDRSLPRDRENASNAADDDTSRRSRHRPQETSSRDKDHKDRPRRGGDAPPPLPPGGPDEDRNDDRRGPPPGYGRFPGAPLGYGGFPPPPGYGPPMGFYPPPPYGPMPPYDMGFHGRGPYMPPPPPVPASGPKPYQVGPRGPRGGFQNKKWVNPQAAKSDDAMDATDGNDGMLGEGSGPSPTSAPPAGMNLNARAAPFMPRNPFFSSQMRPRFQNKTWVRADAAQDEQLDASLPQTPPQDLENAAET